MLQLMMTAAAAAAAACCYLRWNENETDEMGHPLCPQNGERYGKSRTELPQVKLCVLSIGRRSER